MEPVSTLFAGVIAKLAFDKFVKAGAGETAKQSVGGAIKLVKHLCDKIQSQFKGNAQAEAALAELEQQGTPAALEKVTEYLDLEMTKDIAFAGEVQQIAQQIVSIQNQSVSTRQYINHVRDQISIETNNNQKYAATFASDNAIVSSITEHVTKVYPLWYGTNRKPINPKDISNGYSGDRDDLVHYGSCEVAVPESHKIGSTGSSWWQRLKTLTDDRLKLDRSSLNLLDEAGFLASMKKVLDQRKPNERSVLVYIHGFNVSFENAALRAAQIGSDLNVPGIMAFYSWPSKGNLRDYLVDQNTIEASAHHITEFLLNLAQNSDATKIHIIAHSMGNLGLLRSMQQILSQAQSTSLISFGQIFLAAPDIDPDLFKNLAQAYSQLAERTTLYISSKDKALAASGIISNFPRVGYFPPIGIFNGIDTVEVSNVDFSWLGHGYFADARDLLQDMHELLSNNTPPERRFGLQTVKVKAEKFWVIGR